MLFRYHVLLIAQAALSAAQAKVPAVSYPFTIEIDLLFPRNETYTTTGSIPVLFAIQNTIPAWAIGFDLSWNMSSPSNNIGALDGPVGSAHVSWAPPPTGGGAVPPSDPFFVVNSTKPAQGSFLKDVTPGTWTLGWSFGSPEALPESCFPGAILAQGTVDFTIAQSGGLSVDYAGNCPETVGIVTVESYEKTCGVKLASPKGPGSPCSASLSPTQASSVAALLAHETASSSGARGRKTGFIAAAGVPMLGALLL